MAPVSTGYADLGSNHHIAIYSLPTGKADFDVVSLFEAARRLAKREPVVRRDRGDGSRFVMSLSAGDVICFPADLVEAGYRVVQGVWASGVVVTLKLNDASGSTIWRPSAGSLVKSGARKCAIDPIGRSRPAND